MLPTSITPEELIEAAKELPGAPRLLIELGLIRMANSVAYARETPAASTEDAVNFIGFSDVHRLVGALAVTQMAERPMALHGVEGNRLRQISLFTAVLMEELAGPAGESRRLCYTVGLLRSIGIMALEIIGHRHGHVPDYNPGIGQPLDEWEKCHWGLSNPEVAEIILKNWRLPHETVSAIRHHYRPAGRHNPIIHLLALAANSASDRFQGIPGEEFYWQPNQENFVKAGLSQLEYQQASERAQRTFQRLQDAMA
jgi:HD-like signal output (HDOD) protein